MTLSTQRDKPIRECGYPGCSETDKVRNLYLGEYCTPECETRAEGHEALSPVRYDHRICFSCFRTLKTVEEPKPDFEFAENGHGWTLDVESNEFTLEFYSQEVTRDSACGFQHLTPNAGKGEKQHGERVITGTICRTCGNTDHKAHNRVLADREAIGRLVSRLVEIDDDELEVGPETIHRLYEGVSRQTVGERVTSKIRGGKDVDPEKAHRRHERGLPLNLAVGRAVE